MSVSSDLNDLAKLCRQGADHALDVREKLGQKPLDEAEASLWDQQDKTLSEQIDSLTALVSNLTAAAVIADLNSFAGDMQRVAALSKAAKARIEAIQDVSELLTKLAAVLDLGLAVLAAAAAPSPEAIGAVVSAGTALEASLDPG